MLATPLARVSGVSVAHFSRAFGLALGVPSHRYLLTLRLARATALLRDTDLPVTQVAFACGGTSLGTFSRTFRAVLGERPTRYRAGPHASAGATAPVPACVLRPAHGPDLEIAVSEKQRREAVG